MQYEFIHYFLLLLLQDGTHAGNCPKTPDEMDTAETIVSDQAEITGSNLLSSSSPTERNCLSVKWYDIVLSFAK